MEATQPGLDAPVKAVTPPEEFPVAAVAPPTVTAGGPPPPTAPFPPTVQATTEDPKQTTCCGTPVSDLQLGGIFLALFAFLVLISAPIIHIWNYSEGEAHTSLMPYWFTLPLIPLLTLASRTSVLSGDAAFMLALLWCSVTPWTTFTFSTLIAGFGLLLNEVAYLLIAYVKENPRRVQNFGGNFLASTIITTFPLGVMCLVDIIYSLTYHKYNVIGSPMPWMLLIFGTIHSVMCLGTSAVGPIVVAAKLHGLVWACTLQREYATVPIITRLADMIACFVYIIFMATRESADRTKGKLREEADEEGRKNGACGAACTFVFGTVPYLACMIFGLIGKSPTAFPGYMTQAIFTFLTLLAIPLNNQTLSTASFVFLALCTNTNWPLLLKGEIGTEFGLALGASCAFVWIGISEVVTVSGYTRATDKPWERQGTGASTKFFGTFGVISFVWLTICGIIWIFVTGLSWWMSASIVFFIGLIRTMANTAFFGLEFAYLVIVYCCTSIGATATSDEYTILGAMTVVPFGITLFSFYILFVAEDKAGKILDPSDFPVAVAVPVDTNAAESPDELDRLVDEAAGGAVVNSNDMV